MSLCHFIWCFCHTKPSTRGCSTIFISVCRVKCGSLVSYLSQKLCRKIGHSKSLYWFDALLCFVCPIQWLNDYTWRHCITQLGFRVCHVTSLLAGLCTSERHDHVTQSNLGDEAYCQVQTTVDDVYIPSTPRSLWICVNG